MDEDCHSRRGEHLKKCPEIRIRIEADIAPTLYKVAAHKSDQQQDERSGCSCECNASTSEGKRQAENYWANSGTYNGSVSADRRIEIACKTLTMTGHHVNKRVCCETGRE